MDRGTDSRQKVRDFRSPPPASTPNARPTALRYQIAVARTAQPRPSTFRGALARRVAAVTDPARHGAEREPYAYGAGASGSRALSAAVARKFSRKAVARLDLEPAGVLY